MKKEYKKITFRLEVELVDELKELSKQTGVSQTFLIKKALKNILKETQKEELKNEK